MAGVTPGVVAERWGEVRRIIGEIPTREELEGLYREIGAKATLADLEVPEEKLGQLLDYSPLVRNRLTLMRVRRMLK